MNPNRRKFIKKIGSATGALCMLGLSNPALAERIEDARKRIDHLPAEAAAQAEDFWNQIHQAYTVSPTVLNLNNGGVSPQPKVVQDAFFRFNQMANEGPSKYMDRAYRIEREPLRKELAKLAGCLPGEIAINRNASEAIETVIFGLPLTKGDEVVLCKQDYPNMVNAWKQRELRDGIVLKWLSFDFPITDRQAVVQEYAAAITVKTKLIHITHMMNWDGQIMPVKEVTEMAHRNGVEVLVDAAHSFAHIQYTFRALGCDYLGTSLHKWLCAPFGTGMLYVKKDKIKKVFPLLAAPEPLSGDIRKFESLGTRAIPAEIAISTAIGFHELIGAKRKETRLRYLKNYWIQKASEIDGFKALTANGPDNSCAISLFSLEGIDERSLMTKLFTKYGIHVIVIKKEKFNGIRVTPNTYTRLKDLDRFVEALKNIAKNRK